MPELRTANELLGEAKRLASVSSSEFNLQTRDRFNAIMRLFDATQAEYPQIGQLSRKAQAEMFARTIDPATLAFFCGHRPQEDQISVTGLGSAGRLLEGFPTAFVSRKNNSFLAIHSALTCS
jgi:hypothetical protein